MPSWMLIVAECASPLLANSQPPITGPALLLISLAILLGLFFLAIVLLTAIRIRRRHADREYRRQTTPTATDPWREAGARLGHSSRGGDRAP